MVGTKRGATLKIFELPEYDEKCSHSHTESARVPSFAYIWLVSLCLSCWKAEKEKEAESGVWELWRIGFIGEIANNYQTVKLRPRGRSTRFMVIGGCVVRSTRKGR